MDIAQVAAVAVSVPTSAYGVAPAPMASDVDRFRALVSGEVAAPAAPVAQSTPPAEPANIGEVILKSLEGVRDRIQTAYTGIDGVIAPNAPPPSVTEVLALQYRLMQVNVEYELVSKVVSKSAQNLEQLVKVQ
jgi:type III secretion protein I